MAASHGKLSTGVVDAVISASALPKPLPGDHPHSGR